ncbi:MAG: trimeric intracellular cation channel family protein [Clostridiales bacterium]|nr:trimeric intracellular cation channel family protein [Clostridiales bacterium]
MILLILEIIGTISFAISGAVVAIKAKFDIFGVTFVGVITAMGGGIVRDIIIGRYPPAVFSNFYIFLIAVITSIIVFIIIYKNKSHFSMFEGIIEYINNFFDAVGLAAFSVMGTEVAFIFGFSDNMFLAVTLGVLTGIGGGIFRDILTDTTPYVFKKHIYAIASILGSSLYYLLRMNIDNLAVISTISMVLVVAIRMLAAKYHWSLPKINLDGE